MKPTHAFFLALLLLPLAAAPAPPPAVAVTVNDRDGDGCSDGEELGPNAARGGLRDPDNFWDVFDTPDRDQSVSVGDVFRVIARFGATRAPPPTKEEALAEALTTPPPAPAYHVAFDRSTAAGKLAGPPDGAIVVGDIFLVVAQFGHTCLGPEVAGTWGQGSPMPTARTEVTSAALDGVIYVIGGFLATGTNTDVVEAYDTTGDSWSVRAPLPQPLDHAGAAAVGGKLYVVGGYTSLLQGQISSATYEYDPALDSWTPRAPMPLLRAAAATVAVGDVIYVLGGVGPQPTVPLAYRPATDSWMPLAPMGAPREHLTASVVDGKIYVVGGRWLVLQDTNLPEIQNLNTAEVYDPASDTWQPLTPMPTARGGLASGALAGRVHVVGGEDLAPGGSTFLQHELYDPGSDAWQPAPPLPTPRHGLTAQVVDGKLYVIGGGPTPRLSVSDAVEIFQLKP